VTATTQVAVHFDEESQRACLRAEAMAGLSRRPKELSPKWFYDARGSELFEMITRLDEYYPTRREREILERNAEAAAALTGADTMIELGSGSSDKTRLLLDAFTAKGQLRTFVPFDVSEAALRASAADIAARYPGCQVKAIVGDFDRHLGTVPKGGRRLVAFLGGTVGNYPPAPRARLLAELASVLDSGDSLLLGTDLVKSASRLEAAYDDASGVTAEFNLNVLRVLNRELGGDFDTRRFRHVAAFDRPNEWIEMRLRSLDRQRVTLREIGLMIEFAEGEEMRTEISAKFRRDRVEAELDEAGFDMGYWWTDRAGDFALSLSFVR
jgi:L-histidine N-alpha-methyltransferase